MEVPDIKFRHPFFMYVIGKSETGKTFFINEFVRQALKKKFKILYVVNSAFDLEKEIEELTNKNKNVFVIKTKHLGQGTIDFITKSLKSDNKKLIITDNFTYGLTSEFLNFTTFSRKYNASTVFISHSLYSSKTISPRLRELVSYFVLLYLPDVRSIDRILTQKQAEIYEKEILFRSFRFMLIDNANSTWLVSKLPEFKIDIVFDKKKEDKKEDEKRLVSKFDKLEK